MHYSSPLICLGVSYLFLHKSLRDFAIAQSILQDESLCVPSVPLNEFPIVDDHGIIDFIVEEAEQNQKLQAQLLECVEELKQNPEVANAAANAVTVLVRAGKQFHKYDLRGIRILGADIRTVGIYSHMHGTRMMDHGICWLTDGGNWDMRQNVRMEAIGNPVVRIKEAEFPIE